MRRTAVLLFALAACRNPAPPQADAAPATPSATAPATAAVTAKATATASALAAADAGPPPACDVERAHFRLTKALHGVDGTLSLLACPDLGGLPVWEASEDPDRRGVLRVVSDSGRELDRVLLGSATVSIEQKVLRPDGRPTFLVTEDLTAAFGTYSGPSTTLYDVEEAHLAPVLTNDGKEMSGAQTMHATWHLERRGKGQDFLGARIVPKVEADGGTSFETRFVRFSYTKDGWVAVMRTEPGEAEFVDGADRGHYPPPP